MRPTFVFTLFTNADECRQWPWTWLKKTKTTFRVIYSATVVELKTHWGQMMKLHSADGGSSSGVDRQIIWPPGLLRKWLIICMQSLKSEDALKVSFSIRQLDPATILHLSTDEGGADIKGDIYTQWHKAENKASALVPPVFMHYPCYTPDHSPTRCVYTCCNISWCRERSSNMLGGAQAVWCPLWIIKDLPF